MALSAGFSSDGVAACLLDEAGLAGSVDCAGVVCASELSAVAAKIKTAKQKVEAVANIRENRFIFPSYDGR